MALTSLETLNVFTGSLSTELRDRSKSTNLVRTRAPFLRFTTAANMSDLALKITSRGDKFLPYNGCQFFTLGLHGYENVNYAKDDLYGTQSQEGLVIGTTYKQDNDGSDGRPNKQILVRTFGGQIVGDSAKNFPPPGITSAKVERLRNGNVLKFTVETQCYTQEQLEMLDAVCYVPGMTCILEWGTQYTTTSGVQALTKKLNFTNVQETINSVIDSILEPRSTFIDKWCKPNKYNYDWAVANIANIKTTVQDNIYKTTIVAYGRADNLMYISAYATNNPLVAKQQSQASTSITNFFKLNGEFSNLCKRAVLPNGNEFGTEYKSQIVKFTNEYDRKKFLEKVPTSANTGQANDTGLEDTYFMTMDFFITVILNGPVKNIVDEGFAENYKTSSIIASAPTSGENAILCGYNKNLRSTSPEVMIIFNNIARTENSAPKEIKEQIIANISANPLIEFGALRGGDERGVGTIDGTIAKTIDGTIAKLQKTSFDQGQTKESGVAPLSRGVWINSKAIQAAFINARTIMEGMETLLNNMNAATENYWDLKLFYDEELQSFRIVDDNLRTITASMEGNVNIYEFNKRLSSLDGDTIGPDVLSIQIQTDYPKIFFSQLAIAGINNLPSSPIRREKDFTEGTSVRDIFKADTTPTPSTPSNAPTPSSNQQFRSFVDSLFGSQATLYGALYTSDFIIDSANTTFASGISPGLSSIIREVFNNQSLLTPQQAQAIKQQLNNEAERGNLNQAQSALLSQIFLKRAEAIIRRDKQKEIDNLNAAFKDATDKGYISPGLFERVGNDTRQAIREKIIEDRDNLISSLRKNVESVEQTEAQRAQRARDSNAKRFGDGSRRPGEF